MEQLFESPSLLPSSLSQYTHGTTESLDVWKLSRAVHFHPLKVTFKKWIEEQTGLILPIAVCVSPAVLLPPASLADKSDHYNMDLIKSDQSDQVWSGVIRIIHQTRILLKRWPHHPIFFQYGTLWAAPLADQVPEMQLPHCLCWWSLRQVSFERGFIKRRKWISLKIVPAYLTPYKIMSAKHLENDCKH